MKLAVPITKNNNEADISARFSRSQYFAIIDKKLNKTEIIENCFRDMKVGAGKAIVEYLINNHKVDAFAAFEIGLKVQQIATEKNIQLIILTTQNRTLQELQIIINR